MPIMMSCGCPVGTHIGQRNLLQGAAERDGQVCDLGWPVSMREQSPPVCAAVRAETVEYSRTEARALIASVPQPLEWNPDIQEYDSSYCDGHNDALQHARDLATQLNAAVALIGQLRTRQQELLALTVRRTNETPFPDEIEGWTEQRAKMLAEIGALSASNVEMAGQVADRNARILYLEGLINTPHTDEFVQAVQLESAHWSVEYDKGKSHADWITLIITLLSKSTLAYWSFDQEKRLHHLVSIGAALLNWWRLLKGDSAAMRPGVGPERSTP